MICKIVSMTIDLIGDLWSQGGARGIPPYTHEYPKNLNKEQIYT
jgi:hypothetical protein